jgi:hypothetical protein
MVREIGKCIVSGIGDASRLLRELTGIQITPAE